MPNDNAKTSSEIEHVDWSTGTGSGHHYASVRFGSGSSQASQSSGDICRICHCESDPQNPLLTPCYCAGSLKYVHQTCLQQWLTASETNSCELCKFPFIMHTKIKPFNEWRSLDISGIERRRLCCSVLFHCAAALCVIWSLCVLIERAADDVQRGLIDWPFWTKLAVVTVGLTGGVVFMYIQCKAYLHLCHRWKARNRILLIQNAPEKLHPLSPPSPATQHRSLHAGHSDLRDSVTSAAAATVDIDANVATASHAYNYAASSAVTGSMATGDRVAATHLHNAPASPHMLQQAEVDIARSSAAGMHEQPHHFGAPHHLGQVAVAANIECSQSQHNYERDWALDDVVSQISSFRPCPQGSGSMTPFHDSIHNVLEHSETSSRGSVNNVCGDSHHDLSTGGVSNSDTGHERAMHLSNLSGSGEQKASSISSGASNPTASSMGGFTYKPHTKRYSNSSIFLENRDILNDAMPQNFEAASDYLKINYRHSSILTPTVDGGNADQLEQLLIKDQRRYSDTKLLAGGDTESHNKRNVATAHTPTTSNRLRQLLKQHSTNASDAVLDMKLPTSPLSPPAAYAGAVQRYQPGALRRSMHTIDVEGINAAGGANANAHTSAAHSAPPIDRACIFFNSLPNLSSSRESLIKK